MNIYTVRDNLKNTIAGKEKALEGYREDYKMSTMAESMALSATIEFLEININELKCILADVEKCVEKATADSWALTPDRSGGQFTQDEIDNHGRWI